MNIFKRITSFATNSWRDFIENHEPIIDSKSISNSSDDNKSHSNDAAAAVEIIENEENFVIRKSLSHMLLKKRIHKKKTITSIMMDDPRSPANNFVRTPILVEQMEYNDVLSPFNVTDMLDAVESAIECNENTLIENVCPMDMNKSAGPKTPIANNYDDDDDDGGNIVEKKSIEKYETIIQAENDDKILKIDQIYDWNKIEFKEKPLTDSMIVETSVMSDMTRNSMVNQSETQSLIDNADDVDDDDNDDDDENVENNNCKIIGYTVKTIDNHQSILNNENIETVVSSTPKKQNQSLKQQRTPLMSIGNSPVVKSNMKKFQKNHSIVNKKRITNGQRKLPKQPSTPMTPLNRNHMQNLISFDKENF